MNLNADDDKESSLQWLVLVNQQLQYSIWPVSRPVPAGWNETGPEGAKEDCLAFIAQQWTDMRPASIR